MIEVKPTAESEPIACDHCDRTFAVVLEPNLRVLGEQRAMDEGGFKKAAIKFCPFCGEEDIAPDE